MAETLSYNAIRTANLVRELDEQKTEARRKNLLILVVKYLYDEGYVESAKSLERETNINLSRFEVCDNVNLETVFLDFEAYYHVRLKRQPQIIKKVPNGDVANRKPSNSCPAVKRIASLPKLRSETKPPSTPPSGSVRPTSANKKVSQKGGFSNGGTSNGSCENLSLQGLLVTQNATSAFTSSSEGNHVQPKLPKTGKPIIDFRAMINDATKLPNTEGNSEDKLLKPLGSYMGYSTEWRELAQVIQQDIYSQNPNVKWDDIIGLDNAKSLVKESVVYPIKYPQLFTGILSAWKGLLLYGPPGTGKTLLAKAVATECKTTFFNISASSIVSKWRGDSEKLVRVLFELARHHAPSTIFLDELDALMSQRGGQAGGGEHEGSRRMKTELLVQMDGLAKTDDLVFLLAASNIPWELDHAMLRRLEKRILVGLPTPEARQAMFQHYLPPVVCSASTNGIDLSADLDYEHLAELTDGYSGSDIRLVCKEAAMKPVRKVFAALENLDEGVDLQIHLDTITMSDAEAALANTKPSARGITQKYFDWQKEFESV